MAHPPAAAPDGDTCPLCGAELMPGQEWCLRCGAAARTRLAAAPNWRAPVLAGALLLALALGVLAAALVKLAGDSGPAPAPITHTVTTTAAAPAAAATAPATTAPATAAPSGGVTATTTSGAVSTTGATASPGGTAAPTRSTPASTPTTKTPGTSAPTSSTPTKIVPPEATPPLLGGLTGQKK
jgi:hypothetical protein